MLDDQACSHCGNEYDKDKYIPKILNCSHVVCLRCISERLQACPECNETIKEPASDLPTDTSITLAPEEGALEDLKWQKFLLKNLIEKEWETFNEIGLLGKFEETSFSSLDATANELTDSHSDHHALSSMVDDKIPCAADSTPYSCNERCVHADCIKTEFINKVRSFFRNLDLKKKNPKIDYFKNPKIVSLFLEWN